MINPFPHSVPSLSYWTNIFKSCMSFVTIGDVHWLLTSCILCVCCQDLVGQLQLAHQEHLSYQDALQECEKWLLQMSFRLMAHNSLNVNTKELTEKQIAKHNVRMQIVLNKSLTLMLVVATSASTKWCKKNWKMTETLANGYSSESSQMNTNVVRV